MSSFTINFYQILIIAKLSQSNKSIPSDLNVILYYKFECGAGYVVGAHKKQNNKDHPKKFLLRKLD